MLETRFFPKPRSRRPRSPRPEQLSFFDEPAGLQVMTEGVKYSGSKLKLLPYILSAIKSLPARPPVRRVFDGFSGTTRVSQALAKSGYQVISNDAAVWSKIFGECYLKGKATAELREKIDYLNNLKGRSGWFTKHYGGKANGGSAVHSDGKKKIWQIHNTKKLDAIRPEIDKISDSPIERSILLTSLILALDRVDSALGHYVSYLREWSPRSFNKMKLSMPLIERGKGPHFVMSGDIFKALPKVKADLSYFDPPYGSNNEKMPPSRVRYSSYYHIWKTVILNDEPELAGKANRRADCNDLKAGSVFEAFQRDKDGRFIALKAIERLIEECRSPYMLLSYSSGGRAAKEEICEVIESRCTSARVFSIDYRRNVMSGMRWTHDWTRKREEKNTEFLFLMEKQPRP